MKIILYAVILHYWKSRKYEEVAQSSVFCFAGNCGSAKYEEVAQSSVFCFASNCGAAYYRRNSD